MLAWHLTPSEWPLLSEQLCLLHHFIAVTKPAWDERTVGRWRTSYYWSHFSVQGPGNFLREKLSVTGLDGVNVLTGQRSGHHQGGQHDWETLPRWLLRLPSESPHQNLQENNESHVLVCVEVSGKKSREGNQKVESSLYSVLRPNLIIIWGSQISITFT